MKKIMIIIIVLFLVFTLNVKASTLDSYVTYELYDGIYAHRVLNGVNLNPSMLAFITANGKTAYCVQPGILIDKDSYYNSTLNITDTNLLNVDVNRLSLIGYYGYGYKNHLSKEYYMATQELIWRSVGVSDMYWSDSKSGGNVINIEDYKNEILSLVNNYEIVPEFDFKDEYIIGDEVILEDKNKVLNNFEVYDNENVFIYENKIKINVTENNNFSLKRKKNNDVTTYYYKSGYQTIGTFNGLYDVEKNYNVNASYSKIIINKLDYDTKENKPYNFNATLKGAVYGLYDNDNNLIEKKETNKEGVIEFLNLKKGKYYIRELNPSFGYNIDENIYEVDINYEKEITLDLYEKIIKSNVTIKKVLAKNNGYIAEENIMFNLYDSLGDLYNTYYTDENGIINIILPFGKYALKQINAPYNTTYAEDTIINIDKEEDKEILIVNYEINKISELPNTGKNDFIKLLYLFPIFLILRFYEKKS